MSHASLKRRFIKISADGKPLPIEATEFVAAQEIDALADGTHRFWCTLESDEGTHAEAQTFIDKLNADQVGGFSDWRLPTRKELFSLTDDEKYSPAIDTAFFPNCKSDWYWTSTPWARSPRDYAWGVVFGLGFAYWGGRNVSGFVRAVRVGQSLGVG